MFLAVPPSCAFAAVDTADQEPTWLQTLEVIVWPLLILVILGLLLLTPSGAALMRTVFARIRGVEALGVKLDFTEASATKVRESLEETFHRYRQDSQHEFDRLERMYDINFYRTEVLSKCVLPHIAEEVKNDFRCTIHVQDLLFEESLYQLLDYIPSGGGRGRAFPVRFGILGKTWRSQKSQGQGTVPTDAERLIVDWGMTPDEALGAGRGSSRSLVRSYDRPRTHPSASFMLIRCNEMLSVLPKKSEKCSWMELKRELKPGV
jgi:hypothetical protein